MTEYRPKCNPNGIYSVKRVCAELGICNKTLRKLRNAGLIRPINPENKHRPKYSGQAIMDCWDNACTL